MFWPYPTLQPTHPPTYPPNHTPTYGWGILHKFQIFKWIWNILISSSVIKFLLIPGVHPWGWWMGWWGWGWVWMWGMCHAHMHAHVHMHMHVKHDKHAKHGCLHVGGHLQFLYMYTCAYMHVCVCVHVGTTCHVLRCPQTPPPTCSLPRATGSPKHQNSISLELIKIIRFCLKILYLWTLLNSYRP